MCHYYEYKVANGQEKDTSNYQVTHISQIAHAL